MSTKILTMSGAGECPTCAPCPTAPRTTLVVVKKQRYPHGRHCERLNESGTCRCAKWGTGRGEKVSEKCKRAGREYRIGAKVLKTKD
jgi:hypothetical protein